MVQGHSQMTAPASPAAVSSLMLPSKLSPPLTNHDAGALRSFYRTETHHKTTPRSWDLKLTGKTRRRENTGTAETTSEEARLLPSHTLAPHGKMPSGLVQQGGISPLP